MAKLNNISPVIKWAGGKRWLIHQHSDLFPHDYTRLVEPFLGGASIFLKFAPSKSLLADINSELITTYKAIKDDWISIVKGLKEHQKLHCKDHYYNVRTQTHTDPVKIAVRFLYLNRTCWNGLYRVNKNGMFNVPIGTKTKVILPTDDFEALSKRLRKGTELINQDFRKTLKMVNPSDFVYIDPPYIVNHNKNGFLKYNESIFCWDDQLELRNAVDDVATLGAKVIVSQANHHSVRKLYRQIGTTMVIRRNSMIASNSQHRKKVEELLISINC